MQLITTFHIHDDKHSISITGDSKATGLAPPKHCHSSNVAKYRPPLSGAFPRSRELENDGVWCVPGTAGRVSVNTELPGIGLEREGGGGGMDKQHIIIFNKRTQGREEEVLIC